jgi:hypothetical protein
LGQIDLSSQESRHKFPHGAIASVTSTCWVARKKGVSKHGLAISKPPHHQSPITNHHWKSEALPPIVERVEGFPTVAPPTTYCFPRRKNPYGRPETRTFSPRSPSSNGHPSACSAESTSTVMMLSARAPVPFSVCGRVESCLVRETRVVANFGTPPQKRTGKGEACGVHSKLFVGGVIQPGFCIDCSPLQLLPRTQRIPQ